MTNTRANAVPASCRQSPPNTGAKDFNSWPSQLVLVFGAAPLA